MTVRREVLGDAHVDRAIAGTTDFTRDFQELITAYAWGEIWTRPGLDRRSRSMITLTALIARGHHEELAMHVRAALRNGLTVDEIKEVILQSAIYCGVPDANTAFRIASGGAHRGRTPMTSAYVYAAVRTPFGRFGGALAEVRPDDLAATAITGALAQAPGLDPAAIGDVVWGCANQAGEDNRNVGRMAVLLAGLPVSVPATTVNRLCGSSLDAAIIGSRTIESGDADVVLTGGVESMTRAPWVLPKPSRAFPAGNVTAVSTTLGWRLVNDRMPAEWTVSLGEANELLGEKFSISRGAAGRVRRSLARAGRRGLGRRVLRRPRGRRRGRRAGARREHPAGLDRRQAGRPQAVVPPGRHHHRRQRLPAQRRGVRRTARVGGRRRDHRPRARSPGSPGAGCRRSSRRCSATRRSRPPTGRWPGPGSPGPTSSAVELNEAFAVQSIACVDAWAESTLRSSTPRAARSRSGTRSVPPAGGSSAPSRPGWQESGGRYGVAAICIGVGQALAVVLENVS